MDTQDLFFAHQVVGALFAAADALKTRGGRYLKELSIRQMMVMAAVIHLPQGEETINNIARAMGTTKQSVTQVIDAMEKKRYLRTAPSERDKRAVNITITPQGEQVNQVCSQRINEFAVDVFQGYTRDELETLWALLQKLHRQGGAEPTGFAEHMNPYIHPQGHQSEEGTVQ